MYFKALVMVQSPKPVEMHGAVHQLWKIYVIHTSWDLPYLWIGSNNHHLDSWGRQHFHRIRLRGRIQSHPPRLLLHTHISDCNDWCTTLHPTRRNNHHRGWIRKAVSKKVVVRSFSWFTWYFLPFLSTQPHCQMGTQTLPFCTKPSMHTHPGLHASFCLQSGGPFRCVHVGLQAGTQGEEWLLGGHSGAGKTRQNSEHNSHCFFFHFLFF